jgi:pseudouridine synthase
LLKGLRIRVNHVGRLDQDSEGLLLLTNDGELAFRLTHPKFQIAKKYHVVVQGQMSAEQLSRFSAGISLEDGFVGHADASIIRGDSETTLLEMILREGRKREIRQMCKALGYTVLALQRLEFAGVGLGELRPGEWRYLTDEEIGLLRSAVGLAKADHH